MKRLMLLVFTALLVLALGATPTLAKGKTKGKDKKHEKNWQITVYNLTSGQPMSPPLVVVHKKKVSVWKPRQDRQPSGRRHLRGRQQPDRRGSGREEGLHRGGRPHSAG